MGIYITGSMEFMRHGIAHDFLYMYLLHTCVDLRAFRHFDFFSFLTFLNNGSGWTERQIGSSLVKLYHKINDAVIESTSRNFMTSMVSMNVIVTLLILLSS